MSGHPEIVIEQTSGLIPYYMWDQGGKDWNAGIYGVPGHQPGSTLALMPPVDEDYPGHRISEVGLRDRGIGWARGIAERYVEQELEPPGFLLISGGGLTEHEFRTHAVRALVEHRRRHPQVPLALVTDPYTLRSALRAGIEASREVDGGNSRGPREDWLPLPVDIIAGPSFELPELGELPVDVGPLRVRLGDAGRQHPQLSGPYRPHRRDEPSPFPHIGHVHPDQIRELAARLQDRGRDMRAPRAGDGLQVEERPVAGRRTSARPDGMPGGSGPRSVAEARSARRSGGFGPFGR